VIARNTTLARDDETRGAPTESRDFKMADAAVLHGSIPAVAAAAREEVDR